MVLSVIWHDLECGGYDADLPLWLELARAHPDGPILDVGAGSGRVALALARAGREVIALDCDRELLAALRERAAGLRVRAVEGDARGFELRERGQIALCLVPMQTLQLLGGAAGRAGFLRAARAHLRPGGLLACAIVTELEPFDCAAAEPGPSPESTRRGDKLYVSQARSVRLLPDRIRIERRRRVLRGADGERETRDLVELDRVSVAELEREGADLGFIVEPARRIAPTDEHTGSEVVLLRA